MKKKSIIPIFILFMIIGTLGACGSKPKHESSKEVTQQTTTTTERPMVKETTTTTTTKAP
jgi:hypothetical protein